MSKEEFIEKLANPNKAKVLKAIEDFIKQYGTMISHITYVSYDKGTHNIMLVISFMESMVLDEFMIQMNMVLPHAEVTKVISLSDSDTKRDTYIVQIHEKY